MFDLIDECGKDLKEYGYKVKQTNKFGVSIASLTVDSLAKSKETMLAKGEYYIINNPFLYEFSVENGGYLIELLSAKLKKLIKGFHIKKNDNILIACLGNPDIAADRLGKEVFDGVKTDVLSKNNHIFKFCPNIYFSTGIDTLKMVSLIVKEEKIKLVLIIDSLTTNSVFRLGHSFQITSSGMTPGSGVNRFGKRICYETTGAKCISIGVPFMIFAHDINKEIALEELLTLKDIKENVALAGYIISSAINEVIK